MFLLSRYYPKLLTCFCLFLTSLTAGAGEENRREIQKLRNQVEHLEGRERVTALTRLGYFYLGGPASYSDSALYFGEQALRYAMDKGYRQELCPAAHLCAKAALQLSLVNKGLEYYRLTRDLGMEQNLEPLVVIGRYGMGTALWYQGKFRQAIDTIRLCIEEFTRLGMNRHLDDAVMMLSGIYGDMGNYEKAFDEAQQALFISTRAHDKVNQVLSMTQLGYLYTSIGDYETAMSYFRKAFDLKPNPMEWCYRLLSNRAGDLYVQRKMLDSALIYYGQSLRSHSESKTALLRMGNYHLAKKKYDSAFFYYRQVYRDLKDKGEGNLIVFALLGMGKAALAKGNPHNALNHAYEALELAEQRESKLTLRDAYQLIYSTYEALDNKDSAFVYYKRYIGEKEAVVTNQFKGRLYASRHATQIKMLEKEKSLSEEQLRNNRLLRNFLIGSIIMILFLGLIIFWNFSLKRKNEKLQHARVQTELKRRAAELEMQALRAQMNPHFIFNALSSVNRFILQNDPDQASDYLTRFSRLIRMVLVNSQKDVILLEEELDMLRLYLQMEQLRFRQSFDYEINLSPQIDPGTWLVPPLLLQPFCENAIWHGLMHSERYGKLRIDFSKRAGVLHCIITDNGIGREKAAALRSKSAEKIKSMGLQLTKERLALFNNGQVEASYEMEDLMDDNNTICGTRVKLRIRHASFSVHKQNEPA